MNPEPYEKVNSPGALQCKQVVAFSGIEAAILMGQQDNDTFTVIKMLVTKDKGAPAHISPEEDKVFNVTAGDFLFLVGEQRFIARTGECVAVPKGEIHSFRALSWPNAQMMLVSTPANHERFFIGLSGLCEPHAMEEVVRVCEDYSQELIGPVVELDLPSGRSDAMPEQG